MILSAITYYILIGTIWSICLDILTWTMRTHLKMDWIPSMTNELRIVNLLLWPLCIIEFIKGYYRQQ